MKRIKPITAWGVLDDKGQLCSGHLYSARKYAMAELQNYWNGPYAGFKPIRVTVRSYKQKRKALKT